MFRWIAVLSAIALTVGVAYGQSSSLQVQPAPPLGQNQTRGHMMSSPMMNGDVVGTDPDTMPMMRMMQMMQMMRSGTMGPAMMDQDMMGPMCPRQMGSKAMMGAPTSYLEGRLAFAKSELAIDSSQETTWQAYAAALRSQAQPMAARMVGMQRAMMNGADFPARVDARVEMLESQLSSLKSVRAAAVDLYTHLNADQKQKANKLLPMSLCM